MLPKDLQTRRFTETFPQLAPSSEFPAHFSPAWSLSPGRGLRVCVFNLLLSQWAHLGNADLRSTNACSVSNPRLGGKLQSHCQLISELSNWAYPRIPRVFLWKECQGFTAGLLPCPLPLYAQIRCFQSQYDPGSLSRGPSKVKTVFIIIATPFSYVWLLKLWFSQEFSRGYWWVVEYVLLESCVLSFFCFHF